MKRNALLETIQEACPIKLDIEYIAHHIDMAFTDAIPAIYRLFPAIIDQYCTTYEVAIAHVGEKYYCDLPNKIIQFHLPGSGVRSVDPTTDYDIAFTPATFESIRIQKFLEVGMIGEEVDYFTEVDKVQFSRKPGDNATVKLRLMVPISEKDEDEDIFLPPGAVREIVTSVMKIAQQTPPEKETNDKSGKAV